MAKKKKIEEAETMEAVVETPAKSAEATVYIGRSILGLSQYTVFAGGVIPAHVKYLAEQYEGLLNLIVPVSNLQSARADVRTKGTTLYSFYKNMKKKSNS